MAERLRIALIYQNNENWIGGTYYIQNLVLALNRLPEEKKPELEIITSVNSDFLQIQQLGYPYLAHQNIPPSPYPLPIIKRVINKIFHLITGFDRFEQLSDYRMVRSDVIFPAFTGMLTRKGVKKIYWIPDFQEQVLPEFFSKQEIINRIQSHKYMIAGKEPIVFSSADACKTFNALFPKALNKTYILRFAVTHPDYQSLNIASLKEKYKLDKPYFFVSNQFWKHKNHMVVLKALEQIALDVRKDFMIAFSGKEHDYRNPEYANQVRQYVKENNLTDQTRFLGFIDRKEQLKLMSEAIAVIQPSLFEGWSTVVEDAKAMDQWVLVSDLPVHREQLKQNVDFFSAEDSVALKGLMIAKSHKRNIPKPINYSDNVSAFGNDFINIIAEQFTKTNSAAN
jgi:Glycosyltransferase